MNGENRGGLHQNEVRRKNWEGIGGYIKEVTNPRPWCIEEERGERKNDEVDKIFLGDEAWGFYRTEYSNKETKGRIRLVQISDELATVEGGGGGVHDLTNLRKGGGDKWGRTEKPEQ